MKNIFIITEEEKNRILGLHNNQKNNPTTRVLQEQFSGKPGAGYPNANICKRQNPINVVTNAKLDWKTVKAAWGSKGTAEDNTALKNAFCDGWRPGDAKPGTPTTTPTTTPTSAQTTSVSATTSTSAQTTPVSATTSQSLGQGLDSRKDLRQDARQQRRDARQQKRATKEQEQQCNTWFRNYAKFKSTMKPEQLKQYEATLNAAPCCEVINSDEMKKIGLTPCSTQTPTTSAPAASTSAPAATPPSDPTVPQIA